MPRTARWALANGASSGSHHPHQRHPHGDLENGFSNKQQPRERFRDAIGKVVQDGARTKMKQKLLEGIERHHYESFRKSDAEIKEIQSKKVRNFYKQQNEALDNWLEVDMIVRSISDDIIDSFDPQDSDEDGVPDVGPLQATGNDIAPYLPDDEREKRRKQLKYTTWAININGINPRRISSVMCCALTVS